MFRPDAAFLETAGGLLKHHREWDLVPGYPELLTITKECKERKYRGVVVRLPAPLACVHAASM